MWHFHMLFWIFGYWNRVPSMIIFTRPFTLLKCKILLNRRNLGVQAYILFCSLRLPYGCSRSSFLRRKDSCFCWMPRMVFKIIFFPGHLLNMSPYIVLLLETCSIDFPEVGFSVKVKLLVSAGCLELVS